MREILFRGKRVDNGEWIYGDVLHNSNCVKIRENETDINYIARSYQVIPETVGQYTGLCDNGKNGRKIFEGDICWFYGGEYYSGCWEQNAIIAITDMTDDKQTHYLNNAEYCEVIGNIFDNPELLKWLLEC